MLLRFCLCLEVSVKQTLKSLAVTSFVAVDSCKLSGERVFKGCLLDMRNKIATVPQTPPQRLRRLRLGKILLIQPIFFGFFGKFSYFYFMLFVKLIRIKIGGENFVASKQAFSVILYFEFGIFFSYGVPKNKTRLTN